MLFCPLWRCEAARYIFNHLNLMTLNLLRFKVINWVWTCDRLMMEEEEDASESYREIAALVMIGCHFSLREEASFFLCLPAAYRLARQLTT